MVQVFKKHYTDNVQGTKTGNKILRLTSTKKWDLQVYCLNPQ